MDIRLCLLLLCMVIFQQTTPFFDKREFEALFEHASEVAAMETLKKFSTLFTPPSSFPTPSPTPSQTPSPTPSVTTASETVQTRLMTSGRARRDVSASDTIVIPGRRGPISLTGQPAKVYTSCDSSLYGVPWVIPLHCPVEIWRRRWIVKESTLPNSGLGVFALDRIEVPPNCPPDDLPQLFPYVGAVYKYPHYRLMTKHVPHFREYILASGNVDNLPPHRRRYIDGDPGRCGNIGGYNQSCAVPSKAIQDKKNAEWHYVEGKHPFFAPNLECDFHIMTVAIRTIEIGDEIFVPYSFRMYKD